MSGELKTEQPGEQLEPARFSEGSMPETAEIQHHSSIATAALTFCVGLVVLRLLGGWLFSNAAIRFAAHAEVFYHLQSLIAACTVLYLILRRGEGDFRALFIVTLGLFISNEGLAALARNFGMVTLAAFGTIFNVALFMFSSLTLTAAIADGPRPGFYRWALKLAAGGFLLLSTLRFIVDGFGHRSFMAAGYEALVAAILAALTLCVGAMIALQETRRPRLETKTSRSQQEREKI